MLATPTVAAFHLLIINCENITRFCYASLMPSLKISEPKGLLNNLNVIIIVLHAEELFKKIYKINKYKTALLKMIM